MGDRKGAGEAVAACEDFVGIEGVRATTRGTHATGEMVEVDDDFVAWDEFVGVFGGKQVCGMKATCREGHGGFALHCQGVATWIAKRHL